MDVVASLLAKGEPIAPLSPVTYAILNSARVLGAIFVRIAARRIARQRRR